MQKKCNALNVLLLLSVLCLGMTVLITGCKRDSDSQKMVRVVDETQIDPVVLALIESYSAGVIPDGQDIIVRFADGVTLQKQEGEDLSNSIFKISPKLKGEVYWKDERTIGFKPENVEMNTVYKVSFDMASFIDMKDIQDLTFNVVFRPQDFVVSEAHFETTGDKASYVIALSFANPIASTDVLNLLDDETKQKYSCSVTSHSDRSKDLVISGFPVKEKDYKVKIALNGEPVKVNKSINDSYVIYGNSEFKNVGNSVDKNGKVITVYFTKPLDRTQNLAGFISFNPDVAFTTNIEDNKLLVFVDKQSLVDGDNNKYNLTVSESLKDSDGNKLGRDLTIDDLELSELLPKVKWTDDGVIVPDVEDAKIYFDAVCLNSVILRVIKIYDNNVLSYLQNNDLEDTYGVRRAGRLEKKVRLALDNTDYSSWKSYAVNLGDYVKVEPGGVYQLSLDFDMSCYPFAPDSLKAKAKGDAFNEEPYWNNQSYDYREYYYGPNWWEDNQNPANNAYYNNVEITKNVYLTDLAVTAKASDDDFTYVFVRRISDATPLKGGIVTIYDYQMQPIGEGETDANGFVRLESGKHAYFVVAEDDKGSKSFLKLDNNKSLSYSKFDVSGVSVSKNINGFVYTNRGVWRPGDELQVNFILTDRDNVLPDNYPVVMELLNPSGKQYAKKTNNAPMGGIYCFSVPTNATDPTGIWRANFKVGNQVFTKSLRVETVKPNRLQINFNVPALISLSKPAPVKMSAKWLTGLNASGLSATVDAIVRKGETSFPKYKNYDFNNAAESFSSDNITVFSAKLDADGSKMIAMDALKGIKSYGFLNATFVTKVFEPDGNFSITSYKTKLSPFNRYVGVSMPDYPSRYGEYYFTGKDWTFDVILLNENGTPVSQNTELEYTVYRLNDYWWWSDNDNGMLSGYMNGTYQSPYRQESISCLQGKAHFTLNIPNKDWGAYLIVVSDGNDGHSFAKVVNFDNADGMMHVGGAGEAPALLSVNSNKTSYHVGDTIKLSFPANDKATAFVTVESASKILRNMYFDKLTTDYNLKFVATEDMCPNVYLSVYLVQPHNTNNGLPIRLYGMAPIKVENEKDILKPEITMPASSNSQQTVSIKVSEANKKHMYYTLAVVDEGILGLTNFKTPDPYGFFNKKQALKVRTWDNYDYIVDAFTGDLSSLYAVGGDDAIVSMESVLDKRFKAVATTMGPFELKAGATNKHDFAIPEYNGSLRVMVIAHDQERAFGSAQKDLKVIDPIMLIATAPRFVSPDDELDLSVLVKSPEYAGKTLTVTVDNKNLTMVGAAPQTVTINKAGEGEIAMKVKANRTAETAVMNVTVSGGNYKAKTKVEMPMRLPYSERYQKIEKTLEPHATQTVAFDMNGIKGTFGGDCSVYSSIPLNIFGRLNYLVTYPHGCLEQFVSGAFPQLYLGSLMQLDAKSLEQMKAHVDYAIKGLKEYERSDNSFANWPGGNYVQPWTELYALHFMIEASKLGYNVPSNTLQNTIKHQVNNAKAWNFSIDNPGDETVQAYRLFVLSLSGNPAYDAMNRFKELNLKYNLSKALLASAYALTGKNQIADKLIDAVGKSEQPVQSDYYVSYGSPVRDLAFCTYAEMLSGIPYENLRKDIKQVSEALCSDEYMDTQTSAFAMFVLGKYAEKSGFKNSPIAVTATINGTDNKMNTNKGSMGIAFTPKAGSNSIQLKNNSDQKVNAVVFAKSIVPEYEKEEKGAWYNFKLRYLDKKGQAVNPASLAQGTDFYVEITVSNPKAYKVTENALSYRIPAGWEIVNDRLFVPAGKDERSYNYVDVRDDRVNFYFDLDPNQSKSFRVNLNATYKGSFMIPSIHCEDMYNDQIYYTYPASPTVVR